jgi:hypothetical protein
MPEYLTKTIFMLYSFHEFDKENVCFIVRNQA